MPAPRGFHGAYFTDLPTRSAYSEGAGPFRVIPRAVAIPADLDDLLALVRQAAQTGTPLVPRGAGSGMPGGNVGGGVMLDLRAFDRPLAVSPAGTATVGAAVTWAALDRAAQARGLRLGPNPSSGASCTAGGMVATNAGGARSLRAGQMDRWVHGVELVSADGDVMWLERGSPMPDGPEVLRRFERAVKPALLAARAEIEARFPRTRKNSSGYALNRFLASGHVLDLVVGSEGTLGLVTRVELALEPRPAGAATVLLALAAVGVLPGVIEDLRRHDPSAIELLDRSFLLLAAPRLPFDVTGHELLLLVEFETAGATPHAGAADDRPAGARAREAVAAVADRCARTEVAISAADRERLWSVRHAASPALAALPATHRSVQIIEDGCVPVPVLDRYLVGVRAAAGRQEIEIVAFGHAGDGHLHVNALVDAERPGLEHRLGALLDEVTGLLVELGGTMSGEHGDGRLRTPLLERMYGSTVAGLFRQVKRAFDPAGIFNPGVIVPVPGADPVRDLKIGPRAPKIPAAVEARLREVERAGAWHTPKTELAPAAGAPDPSLTREPSWTSSASPPSR